RAVGKAPTVSSVLASGDVGGELDQDVARTRIPLQRVEYVRIAGVARVGDWDRAGLVRGMQGHPAVEWVSDECGPREGRIPFQRDEPGAFEYLKGVDSVLGAAVISGSLPGGEGVHTGGSGAAARSVEHGAEEMIGGRRCGCTEAVDGGGAGGESRPIQVGTLSRHTRAERHGSKAEAGGFCRRL